MELIYKKNIDKNKWDDCVSRNANGLIYASTVYMDAMCESYAGLVFGDYEAVFPLPFKTKYFIKYLYHPPFIQQLGLIGNTLVSAPAILQKIKKYFNYGDVMLNYENTAFTTGSTAHVNLILHLNKSYNNIKKGYKNDVLNNVKIAEKAGLIYSSSANINEAVDVFEAYYSNRLKTITADNYITLKRLFNNLKDQGRCMVRVASLKNQVVAYAILLKDDKRVYNIMNTVTDIGRTVSANHFLLNAIIKEFSEQPFEGSDVPGVKSFYEKFGAVKQPYFIHHFNELPWPLKLFKP